jgi:hypothetical protein
MAHRQVLNLGSDPRLLAELARASTQVLPIGGNVDPQRLSEFALSLTEAGDPESLRWRKYLAHLGNSQASILLTGKL